MIATVTTPKIVMPRFPTPKYAEKINPKKKNGQARLKPIIFNNNASPSAPIILPPQLIAASTFSGIDSNICVHTSAPKSQLSNLNNKK